MFIILQVWDRKYIVMINIKKKIFYVSIIFKIENLFYNFFLFFFSTYLFSKK